MADDDAFNNLLERIRKREHPDYGSISWDGERRSFEISVQFEKNGVQEDDQTVRQRALAYLSELTEEERQEASVEIKLREGSPVGAVLRGTTGALDPERLKALEKKVFED